MQDIFITKIKINEVRNIKDFEINLSENERKHLIITGKNGSGKTSLLEELKNSLDSSSNGTKVFYNNSNVSNYIFPAQPFKEYFFDGKFILKYFGAKRSSEFVTTNSAKNIGFQRHYSFEGNIGNQFTQYLVNLNYDRLDAIVENDLETGNKIEKWFSEFENTLANLFEQPKLKLTFDKKNRKYQLVENGNTPYDFNQLPDGYSSVLNIVTELIMRMEEHKTKSYDVQGVVLIDELETHLHIDLQKNILPFLTSFFPKIQFIVTTHSPFVINSISNAIVCDLEKRIVTEDLSGYSYDTIVESYYETNEYSNELVKCIEEFKKLKTKKLKTDEEKDRLIELEIYLDSIPKYWAEEFAIKLQEIKLINK